VPGVWELAAGFLPPPCLSSDVQPLCYICCFQSYVARAWSWTVSHLIREDQRSSELVASRHDAGSFVFTTNLRPQRTADHPDGNGTVARLLFDALTNHVRHRFDRRNPLDQTQRSGSSSA
jgi:hypothetical protein